MLFNIIWALGHAPTWLGAALLAGGTGTLIGLFAGGAL